MIKAKRKLKRKNKREKIKKKKKPISIFNSNVCALKMAVDKLNDIVGSHKKNARNNTCYVVTVLHLYIEYVYFFQNGDIFLFYFLFLRFVSLVKKSLTEF